MRGCLFRIQQLNAVQANDIEGHLSNPDDILNDWSNDPKRPVFLIDETRRPVFEGSDQIIFFTCVSLTGSVAECLQKGIRAARVTDTSLKALDLKRPEVQRDYAPLVGIWCGSLQLVQDINIVATTAKGVKKTKHSKARLRMIYDQPASGRPPIIEDRELNAVIHLVLKTAIGLGIGPRQVDVVLDRSEQIGMSPGKRRLPTGVFEVMGPSRLDIQPDGSRASLECPAKFRLIADSEQGPFRDLLMLPELYGYLLLYGIMNDKKLYESLEKEPYLLLHLDIEKAKEEIRKLSQRVGPI